MATNHALATSGSTASAATSYSAGHLPPGAIDGNRTPNGQWGNGGGWDSGVAATIAAPQILTVNFNQAREISEIDVFTLRDDLSSTLRPTLTETFTAYGIIDFTVEYYNDASSAWVTLATVAGNNKVWRRFTFPALTTTAIGVRVTSAAGSFARIVEVEAWGMLYFPSFASTGRLYSRYWASDPDYKAITMTHTYEDGGRSFSETSSRAALRWEIEFSGITPAQADIFDAFNNQARLANPFNFVDKQGVTHAGVRIEDYSRTHPGHMSWKPTCRFKLVKYP